MSRGTRARASLANLTRAARNATSAAILVVGVRIHAASFALHETAGTSVTARAERTNLHPRTDGATSAAVIRIGDRLHAAPGTRLRLSPARAASALTLLGEVTSSATGAAIARISAGVDARIRAGRESGSCTLARARSARRSWYAARPAAPTVQVIGVAINTNASANRLSSATSISITIAPARWGGGLRGAANSQGNKKEEQCCPKRIPKAAK